MLTERGVQLDASLNSDIDIFFYRQGTGIAGQGSCNPCTLFHLWTTVLPKWGRPRTTHAFRGC